MKIRLECHFANSISCRINPAEKNSKGQEASVHELKKQSNDRQISYFLFQAASRTFSNLGT